MTLSPPFIVSAPGKVIIFGEHAAVFGKPAIAAAVSLRTYLLVTPSDSKDEIILDFPDIGLYQSWKSSELPWDVAEKYQQGKPQPTDELVPEIVSEIAKLLTDLDKTIFYAAASSFLYLYVNLCSRHSEGLRFTVRSTLPIGAGLGSSASISVCLTSALSLLGNHIKPAFLKKDDLTSDNEDSLFIDSWAYMGEKCIHGNPSGIDNAVATHGGAVMFQRMQSSIPSVRTTMRNFPPLKLLLTNTRQPRRTAELVSNVSRLTNEFPKTSSNILDAIEALTREAYNIMIRPFFDEAARNRLRELFQINHGLLIALGVSHPTLERARMLTDEMNVGKTKLTGAGGGGCAITLLNDQVEDEIMKNLKLKYEELGYETYETSLGGKGVGFLPFNNDVSFNPENFKQKTSNEIEISLGAQNDGWKFW
ncbi:Galactokinase [Wickerhamomyces ciferrii]|uniref:Mevalonate kinase n=1 Tax=Wickerhamomyces ciferrii (strain ATCC 14091 / BCRC 22168 / CBS 111 / JCM 3599 / NBRC 0793 / NRRL Y-1031 F-60-10) TaxID=1206466 RepID=K0K890_WICCF|nr:Galactokinase [Wickerhamomyces ciferrii]CCH41045.1 Galactokinase [Wickerhamomyces ciferrii]